MLNLAPSQQVPSELWSVEKKTSFEKFKKEKKNFFGIEDDFEW
jgi:hypothetical protein